MASLTGPIYLAPTGSTGNVTTPLKQVPVEVDTIAAQFVTEAVGATPTVTWKIQGTLDGTNFFDMPYITQSTSATSQAAIVSTTVQAIPIWFDSAAGDARKITGVRLVVTANTNVTFRCELYLWDETAD